MFRPADLRQRHTYFKEVGDACISRRMQLLLSESSYRKIINAFTLTDTYKLRYFTVFHGSNHSTATLAIMKSYKLSFNSLFQRRCCKRKLLKCLTVISHINKCESTCLSSNRKSNALFKGSQTPQIGSGRGKQKYTDKNRGILTKTEVY
jgi:hypothetical protein